jgi:hypothetical protein
LMPRASRHRLVYRHRRESTMKFHRHQRNGRGTVSFNVVNATSRARSDRRSGFHLRRFGISVLIAVPLLVVGIPAVGASAQTISHAKISMKALRALAAEHPPIPAQHPTGGATAVPKGKITQVVSGNWSGYISLPKSGKTTKFSFVEANYSVPSVNCSVTSYAFSYHWVGLDGWNDGTVEQDGVGSFCVNGSPTYFAWYEMYPASPTIEFYLNPGDSISSTVDFYKGNYYLALTDSISGQGFDIETQCASTCNNSSAEVITEGYPSSPYGGTADFGQEHYDTIIVGNNKGVDGGLLNATQWNTDQATAENSPPAIDTEAGPLAQTTSTASNPTIESAFSITWHAEA